MAAQDGKLTQASSSPREEDSKSPPSSGPAIKVEEFYAPSESVSPGSSPVSASSASPKPASSEPPFSSGPTPPPSVPKPTFPPTEGVPIKVPKEPEEKQPVGPEPPKVSKLSEISKSPEGSGLPEEPGSPKEPGPPEDLKPVAEGKPLEGIIPSAPPKKPRFKGILKILPIFLILAILAGGGYFLVKLLSQKKPGEEVTLTYWGLWEDEEILSGVIADWEKDHPRIKINYLRQKKEEYRERLQSALARDEGPDAFRFHNTWLPMFKEELSPMPPSVMSGAEFEEAFYPVATSDLKIGASIYGVPLEIDTLALFYNEDLFRAAGKTPPTNWDQLRRLASELTVRDSGGRIQIAGIAMGGAGNIDHWSDILGLMMLQNGVDLSTPKGKLAEDALTFYTYLLGRDKVWDPNFPTSTLAFAGGKVAMYFGFSWDVFEIERVNKDLNYKIVSVPQLPERDPVAWASYWVEGVAKKSQSQEEAWQFLKYLSSEAVMRKFYQAQAKTRLFGEPYSRKSLASELKNDPLLAPFINQAVFAKSWYLCSRTFDNGINAAMIKYFEDAVNAVNRGGGAATALQTASKGISQVLSRYRVSH